MRVSFYTLGCKVNQYDTQAMRSLFESQGYTVCEPEDMPDVAVLNSCTVTAESDRKTRQSLRRLRRQLPHAVLVLSGCLPQANPHQAEALVQADIVIGNAGTERLPKLIEQFMTTGERIIDILPHIKGERISPLQADGFGERTRAFIKIEDGCDRRCAYCIIPDTRGHVRSRSLDNIVEQTQLLVEKGFCEIVLTGINLTAYGLAEGHNLCDAVEVVAQQAGVERIRLGSLEPDQLTPAMIDRLAVISSLCPHFHLSLQSGCDATLERMRRRYDTAFYARLVDCIRSTFENCSITTDVMTGFPGETEDEFEQSLDFVRQMGFAKAHVFAYSRRPGTPAAEASQQISRAVKEERSRRMIKATAQSAKEHLQLQKGRRVMVLFENRQQENMYEGYAADYSQVRIRSDQNLCGRIVPVRIIHAYEGWCEGMPEEA